MLPKLKCYHNWNVTQSKSFLKNQIWIKMKSRRLALITLVLFLEVLATVVALFWQTGKGGKWQVIWCLRRPQLIHDVGSLCISTMWLFNFFLVKRTLRQELQVKETSGKRDRGEFDQHALLHHQAVLHYALPPLPLHLLLIINILLILLLLFKEVWKAFRPSLLSCRDL